jgi:succinylarginine dihydrolase
MTVRGNACEVNFDGIIGPTHNYSGLSFGNVASTRSREEPSNPRQAALQGLAKMKALLELGVPQGVLPPQERPDVWTLRRLGFRGSDARILEKTARRHPGLLHAVSSASAMWTANAATVSPSADSRDGRVHFTPANLSNKFHRSIEPRSTARALRAIFGDFAHFAHHRPLPPGDHFGDEGAANHTRLCADYGAPGIEFFVYGKSASGKSGPTKYPARQTLEASRAIARLHRLPPKLTVFGQQAPGAIDAGVFHNDVAAVGNRDVFFYHEGAYAHSTAVIQELRSRFERTAGAPLTVIQAPSREISLKCAVESYLFNSQLVSVPNNKMVLIAPTECEENPIVRRYVEKLTADPAHPIRSVRYFNLKESMRNGGGPACLRLRVVLTQAELQACNPQALLTPGLYDELITWVKRHYRDRLRPSDLADPALLDESRTALDELTRILNLGALYRFQ